MTKKKHTHAHTTIITKHSTVSWNISYGSNSFKVNEQSPVDEPPPTRSTFRSISQPPPCLQRPEIDDPERDYHVITPATDLNEAATLLQQPQQFQSNTQSANTLKTIECFCTVLLILAIVIGIVLASQFVHF